MNNFTSHHIFPSKAKFIIISVNPYKSKGIERRFVPGHWEKANGKDHFIYTPGEKTGMVLKMKWVEGSHYWESSIRILEKLYPELLEKKLQSWLDEYFKDFL